MMELKPPRLVGTPFRYNDHGTLVMLQFSIGQYVNNGHAAVTLFVADCTAEKVEMQIHHPAKHAWTWSRAMAGEPWAHLSVNTDDELYPNEFVLSHDVDSALASAARLFFEPTRKLVSYGYVVKQPVWRIPDEWM